jgi:FkbM family methyltransferase
LAFEPHLETFGLLERNVRHNRLEDVTLFQVALGASTGSAAFYTEGAGSLVGNTIAPRGNAKVETARVVPLSQYVAGGVDLLKLDVEGAEGAVIDDLESAGKLPAIRSLVLEYHHNLASQSTPLSRILAQLESAGFTYVLLSAHSGLWGVQRFQDVSIVAERH